MPTSPCRSFRSFFPVRCRRLSRASLISLLASGLAFSLPSPATARVNRVGNAHARQASRSPRAAAQVEERAAQREARRSERSAARATRAAEREAQRAARRRAGHPGAREANTIDGGGQASGSAQTPTPATPRAARTRACNPTIQASSTLVTAGDEVRISGTLGCPNLAGSMGHLATISQSERGAGTASQPVPTSVSAETDGSYAFTTDALHANTLFRIHVGNRGMHIVVKVAPEVTLSAPAPAASRSSARGPSTTRHLARATFSGAVTPVEAGARVSLQVAYAGTDEQWRAVAFGSVDAEGRYSITHGFRTPGQASVRVVVHPGAGKVAGASEALAYEVPQAQNPQLTILSSADPLAFGSSVQITGVAALGEDQPVTLLARTRGGKFSVVARATTEAGGRYSFTQAPLVNTSYEVSDAADTSTVLFEGVRRMLSLDAPAAAVQAGQQLTVSGTVDPAPAGQPVYLERQSAAGINFHVIATGIVNPDGSYSVGHVFSDLRQHVLRVKVPGDAQNEVSATAPFTVQLTAAPAGALAPEAPLESPSPTN